MSSNPTLTMALAAHAPARDLGVLQLQAAYTDGMLTPSQLVESLYPLLQASGPAIIHLLPLQAILARCRSGPARVLASMLWLQAWLRLCGVSM